MKATPTRNALIIGHISAEVKNLKPHREKLGSIKNSLHAPFALVYPLDDTGIVNLCTKFEVFGFTQSFQIERAGRKYKRWSRDPDHVTSRIVYNHFDNTCHSRFAYKTGSSLL